MANPLSFLKFAWDYFVRGKHRIEISDFGYDAPDDWLMDFLADMYRAHGVIANRYGNWIFVDAAKLFTRASWFRCNPSSDNVVIQADFVTVTHGGEHVVESFAGMGPDLTTALKDACKSFQDSSFHVLFTTLLDRPCEHVDRQVWTIGGQPRNVTFGWLRMRGALPEEQWPSVFEGIQRQVEGIQLAPGRHWVRYFYCHLPSDAPTTEVLIDNETHDELQGKMTELPWPETDEFYSARLFFMIEDA